MKKILLNYLFVPPTGFDLDYLRYKITKISRRNCFCHLQGRDYEFKKNNTHRSHPEDDTENFFLKFS